MTKSLHIKLNKGNRLIGLIAALVMGLFAAFPVFALNPEDTANLSVTFQAVDGMEFRLTRIGMIDERLRLRYLPEYEEFTEILDISDTEALNAESPADLAKAAGEIAEKLDAADAEKTFVTEDQTAALTELPLGLYVLTGGEVTEGNYIYRTWPMLIVLPQFQEEDGTLLYNAAVEVKPQITELPPEEPETKRYSVTKRWSGDSEEVRPSSVTVTIMRGTEFWQEVELDAEHGWQYSWEGFVGETYSVMERNIPENYSPIPSGDDTDFILTNVYQPPETPVITETPTETETPTPTDTETPTPAETETPTDNPTPTEEFERMRTYGGDVPSGGHTTTYTDNTGRRWEIVYDRDGNVLGRRLVAQTNAAKTADENRLLIWLLLMLAAAGLAANALRRRRL